jgi:cytochrome c
LYGVIKQNLPIAVVAISLLAIPCEANAAGDAGAGAKVFEQCGACHSAKQGENVVGPSLYGVIGRPAGSVDGFDYSKAMTEAAKKGLTWTPENIVNYLQNPRKFLDDFAGDSSAPNKMTFSLADQKQREDVVAYLQTVGK